LVALGLLAAAIFWLAQVRALALVYPARTVAHTTPDLPGWQQLTLRTPDDIDLSAWYVPPPAGSDAALLFVHGLGGNRALLLAQADLLYDHGYGALLIDLRNHGESGGHITTYGYYEQRDVTTAARWLLDRPAVNRIALVGESMGGASALLAAPQLPEVAAVIIQSSYTSLEDNVSEGVRRLTGLPPFPMAPLIVWLGEREAGAPIGAVQPVEALAAFNRPALIMHGARDELLPPRNAAQLHAAATGPVELVIFENAAHGGLLQSDPALFEATVTAFLAEHLPVTEAVPG
jgi:pimeloyl-ACP methyl ester carboxylesterase